MGLIIERNPVCQQCSRLISNPIDCILHHKVELTAENVSDVNISLNPNNILILCHECHNRTHQRFNYQTNERYVYIVYGPPLSGKTTFVKQNMRRGDIVVDMDSLFEAVSFQSAYDKPNNILQNVRCIHDLLIDNIKTRYGKWWNAWIIGGYADKHKREQLANAVGAELVFCDISKDECITRLEQDEGRKYCKSEWIKYIDMWFDRYST